MALMDELEGVLGADAVAKLPANLRTDLEFNAELRRYYDRETDVEPVRQPARAPVAAAEPVAAAAASAAAPLSAGLEDIEKLFDRRLGTLKTDLTTEITTSLKTEADGMFSRAVSTSLKLADELADVRETHRATFGEKLDSTAFDKYINENGGMARFGGIQKAYESFMGPQMTEKKIQDGIRDGLKQRNSGVNLPGVSPNGSRGPVSILTARRRDGTTPGPDAPKSAVEKAGEALASRLAVNE